MFGFKAGETRIFRVVDEHFFHMDVPAQANPLSILHRLNHLQR